MCEYWGLRLHVYKLRYKYVCLRVDISIMVIGDASDIIRNDRKTPEISNAPLHMKQDTTSIEYLNLMP